MSDTPERIWIGELLWGDSPDPRKVEYVRANMHAAEIARLRAELAERDAEVEKYKAELRVRYGAELAIAQEEFAEKQEPLSADMQQIIHDNLSKLYVRDPEQPRTDAEWKAADRRKRINDLAARYAGQLAFSYDLDDPDQTPLRVYRRIVKHARAIATEIVEAEE